MDDNNKFQEQEAPAKNTDNAFVKVAEDGSPLIPDSRDKKTDNNTSDSAVQEKQ